ncbi:hypothetical protein Tco_1517943 [Tanacetum coccineum]
MEALKFVDSYNMVAYLERSTENVDFDKIVDFLNDNPIRYALTVSPTIYVSYIEQFWATTKTKIVNNERQIRVKVDGNIIVISESSVRRDLQFNDEDAVFNDEYVTPSHTKKVFANMRREGKGFSGTITPLFPSMLTSQAVEGEGSGQPTKPQHIPTTPLLSHVEPILTIATSSHPKKTQKHRKTKRKATEISQSSGPITLVAYETVHKEREDIIERAATTASSLEAKQDSGSGPMRQDTILGDRPAQTRFESLSKQPNEPPLSRVNTLESGEDRIELKELMKCTKLSDRVLDLEKIKNAQALEIQKLKTRVKKLERKKKSRTPQLKRILFKVRIESSAEKSLGDQEDASNQGRNIDEFDQDKGISFVQEDAETQGRYGHDIEVNTASTSITTASINITTVEHVTTASASITTVGVSVTIVEPCTPPTTTTVIEDEDLTITQTLMKMRSVKSKEKLKEKGVSSTRPTREVIMKETSETATRPIAELEEEERLSKQKEEDANIAEWDDVQPMMDADYELAIRLQAEEQRELTIEERYKYTQLKSKSYDEIQKLFDKEMKRVNTFVAMDSEVVEGCGKNTKSSRKKVESSKKRTRAVLDDESVKRQKVEDDAEKAELKACLEIVPGDDSDVNIIGADGSTKYYKIFSAMLDDFDRQDVLDLYRLRLYDSCGVHLLLMDTGISIHMLVEKKYPLTQEMLSRMLSRRLEVDHECEMAFALLRFIKSQYKKIVRIKIHLSVVEVTAASYEVTAAGYSFYC